MEFVDDYFSLDTVKTVEFHSTTIKPECQLNEPDLKTFNQLLRDNSDRFALSAEQLEVCKDVEFNIETDTEIPIHSVPYRQPPKIMKKLEQEVMALKAAGLIRDGTAGSTIYNQPQWKRENGHKLQTIERTDQKIQISFTSNRRPIRQLPRYQIFFSM